MSQDLIESHAIVNATIVALKLISQQVFWDDSMIQVSSEPLLQKLCYRSTINKTKS